MIPKLNLVSSLAALVFFFLPWVRIECNGERMATQTGVQMIIGSATSSSPARQKQESASGDGESLGHSYLAAVALIAVSSALLMSFAALTSGRRNLDRGCGVLCAVALVCLALQLSLGFPAEKAIHEELVKPRPARDAIDNPFGDMGETLTKHLLESVRVTSAPWIYWELAALAFPTLIFGISFLDRLRAKER